MTTTYAGKNLTGILWMLLSAMLFSSMVALVKMLGSRFPSYEIVFFRSSIQILSMMLVFWKIGFTSLKTKRPFLHGVRVWLAVVLINCNYYAFTKLPIADVTAIGFSSNIFLVILAGLFLHERITLKRILVTIAGFAGILLITRPGGTQFSFAVWIALAGATIIIITNLILISQERHAPAYEPEKRVPGDVT